MSITQPPDSEPRTGVPHLAFLDGVRAVASLGVAFFHATLFCGDGTREQFSAAGQKVVYAFSGGPLWVAVFIVLSGFSLSLPFAKTGIVELRGGAKGYFKRRALRILPPYYAALALSLLLIATVPILQQPMNTQWDSKIPAFDAGAILSHLGLFHNASKDWVYRINGPMWSIAVEAQIYLLFPLMILLWKKAGPWAMIAASIILGDLLDRLTHGRLYHSHPWFIGLFALGSLSAWFCHQKKVSPIPALALGAVLFAGWITPFGESHMKWMEILTGVVAAFALATLATNDSKVRQILASKPLATLGLATFSIYLIHSPILALINLETLKMNISLDSRLAMMLIISVPISVAIGLIFYRFVEKPTMNIKNKMR